MADEERAKPRLEIAHVLFMDIVGYSKLLTDEQSEALQELNQIVRNTEAARQADAAGDLTILPTGDGMALVFTGSVEEPAECALEISQALRAQPSLPVRIGIHSGPVHQVKDANQRDNIAGVGINIAQRVMDCGDAGHILVSKRVADDLAQRRRWQPYLHPLGDVEVKHGVVVSLVNFYAETIGNPTPPARIGKVRRGVRSTTRPSTLVRSDRPLALATLILAGLLIALAIVSVIFAPAILRSLRKGQVTPPPPPPAIPSPSSLADTIKNAISKKVTDELQDALAKKKTEGERSLAGSAIPQKSIAVLPFDNLSRDPDNTYFADGIQEEILTRLSKIADLKVISRTSTQQFKNAPANLSDVAQQLGVANVLEGTVQRSTDHVRVSVQLIDARNDSHLWAETFDRKLNDIFAVESEIASKVADSLQAKLSSTEKNSIAKVPTSNTEAYQLYLKGRFFWNKRTAPDLRKAVDFFNQAIEKDPKYALAYAGLADAWAVLPLFGGCAPKECNPKAEAAAKQAIQLDETLAEPHASLGLLLAIYYFDCPGSLRELERAIELNPNYATAHHWIGNLPLTFVGQFDRGIAELKRALELDPLSMITNANLGQTYCYSRRYQDAIAQLRRTIEMDPGFYYAHYQLGEALELTGDRDAAIAEYQKARELNDDPFVQALLAQAMAKSGKADEARRVLDQLEQVSQHRYVPAYGIGLIYLGLGEKDQALRSFEKSYEDRDGTEIGYIKVNPLLDSLRGDPRFEALVEKTVGGKK